MATAWDDIPGFDWANPSKGLESTLAFEHMKLAVNDRAKVFDNVDPIEDGLLEYTNQNHIGKFNDIRGKLVQLLKASADFSLFSDSVGNISTGAHVATYDNYQGITLSPPPVRSTDAMWLYIEGLLSLDLTFWRTGSSTGRFLDKSYLSDFYAIMGLIKYAVFFQNQWFEPITNRGTTKGTAVMREKFVYCWEYFANKTETERQEDDAFACLLSFYDSDPDIASDPNDANMRGYVNRYSDNEEFPGPQGFYVEYQGYCRYGDAKVEVPTALSGVSFSAFNLVGDIGSLGFDGLDVTNEFFNTLPASTAGVVVTITAPEITSSSFTQLPYRGDLNTNFGRQSDYVSYNADAWAYVGMFDTSTILDYST